jgi:hypothetical protein
MTDSGEIDRYRSPSVRPSCHQKIPRPRMSALEERPASGLEKRNSGDSPTRRIEKWTGALGGPSPDTRVHQLAVEGHSGRAAGRSVGARTVATAGEIAGVIGAGTGAVTGAAVADGIAVRVSIGRRGRSAGGDFVSGRHAAMPRAAQPKRAPSAAGGKPTA